MKRTASSPAVRAGTKGRLAQANPPRGRWDHPRAVVRDTRAYGRGVYASGLIRKGEVVAKFDGPIFDGRFNGWTKDLLHHAIQFDRAAWRDSVGIARLLNHSCDPNCGIKRRFELVAMRDIRKGEALTWDYEMTEKSDWFNMRCRCGSELCRKRIGNYKNMPLEIRAKYKGYISSWLTRKPRK